MGYRSITIENDASGFVQPSIIETGGIVITSPKGRGDKPILCIGEADVINQYGTPSADYPNLFEVVAFTRQAPCYIISAIGDNALYGGVTVSNTAVASIVSGTANVDTYTFNSNDIAFALFTISQYESDLKVDTVTTGGSKFKTKLYDSQSRYIKEYNYSLIREKTSAGYSLYYGDVFNDDQYLQFKLNANTTSTTFTALSGTSTYTLGGGSRGSAPSSAQITTAYSLFNSANKYPVSILMDPSGGHATDINNIIQTYQPYAHGISIVPLGNTAAQMVTYRSSTGLDTDNASLYCNWIKVVDPYNNSQVWISNVGGIGAKYAKMMDVYDGLSPAGIDENGHGGQISVWTPIDQEVDLSDYYLQALDEAQVNPIVLDEIYGVIAQGDKTLQVSSSDTSYIGTRRLYNLIIKTVTRQILRRQEFKNNDESHRYKAKSMTDDFLAPIVGLGLFREILVVCDETNNTDATMQLRQFILDIYIRITPNSQFTILRLNRLSQTQSIASFLST